MTIVGLLGLLVAQEYAVEICLLFVLGADAILQFGQNSLFLISNQ